MSLTGFFARGSLGADCRVYFFFKMAFGEEKRIGRRRLPPEYYSEIRSSRRKWQTCAIEHTNATHYPALRICHAPGLDWGEGPVKRKRRNGPPFQNEMRKGGAPSCSCVVTEWRDM